MPASALATEAAFLQIISREDVEAIFDVEIFALFGLGFVVFFLHKCI